MFRRGGNNPSRAESAAVNPDVPLVFKRWHCDTCNEEQIFRGFKCLKCGVFAKFKLPDGRIARMAGKKSLTDYARRTRDRANNLRNDKAAYFARLAAESRAKFEGKK